MITSTKTFTGLILSCSCFAIVACGQSSKTSAIAPEADAVKIAKEEIMLPASTGSTLTVNRYNDVMIGDKLANSGLIYDPDEGTKCTYARRAVDDFSVIFIALDGVIARIDVKKGDLALDNGLKIGSSSVDIEAIYGDKAKSFPNKYDPAANDYVVNISQARAATFELTNGVVMRYRVGLPVAVMLSEGCS